MTEKSKWQQYKEKLGDTRPWDILNPNIEKVSDEIQKIRFNVCQGCDKFIKLTSQCKECGCVMSLKTQLPAASCPLNKWHSVV